MKAFQHDGCRIGQDVIIKGYQSDDIDLIIGENVRIGNNVRIECPEFSIGDYGVIHDNTIIYGQKHCRLGHNVWIGQNSVVNCTGGLTVGDNFGMGLYSSIYTHVAHGDIMEGCRINEFDREVTIGKDVWLIGAVKISGMRNAGDKSVALDGSVITRDMKSNHIYGGAPAIDLTNKLGTPWHEISVMVKITKMQMYLREFSNLHPDVDLEQFKIVENWQGVHDDFTYFDVATREYTKRGTPGEIKLMQYLKSYRAKFTPATME